MRKDSGRADTLSSDAPKIRKVVSWSDQSKREVSDGIVPEHGLKESSVRIRQLLSDNLVDSAVWPSGRAEALFAEIFREESFLEVRTCRLDCTEAERSICRVRHFLRAQVYSPKSRLENCFLFKKWEQQAGGLRRERNELFIAPLLISEVPLGEEPLVPCRWAVGAAFQRLENWNFQPDLDSKNSVTNDLSPVAVESCRFVSHHCDELRPSLDYPGIFDEDHFHLVKVLCHGLPHESFASVSHEQSKRSGPMGVVGWCWLNSPKALGEQWRAINVLEARVFAAYRPWQDFRGALGELSADLSKGRLLLEGDGHRVQAASLATILHKCLSSAQKAKAEHSEALASAAASAYNNPRVQSFVRTTARRETAQVGEDLQTSELQLRRGMQGEKSWVKSEGRRGTAFIGQELVFDRLNSDPDSSGNRSPQLPSPRGILPRVVGSCANSLHSEHGTGDGNETARCELARLAMLLGRQAEEQATTAALLRSALKVAHGYGSAPSPAVSPRQGGRAAVMKPSMRVLASAQPDEETLALLSPRVASPRPQGNAVILDVCRAPFEDALAGIASVLATELQDVVACTECGGDDRSDSSDTSNMDSGAEMGAHSMCSQPSLISELWCCDNGADSHVRDCLLPFESLDVTLRQSDTTELSDDDAEAASAQDSVLGLMDDNGEVLEQNGPVRVDDFCVNDAARKQQLGLVSFEPSGLRSLRPTTQQRFTVCEPSTTLRAARSIISEAVKVGAAFATCDGALDPVPELTTLEAEALGPQTPRMVAERRSLRLPRSFTVDMTGATLSVDVDDNE